MKMNDFFLENLLFFFFFNRFPIVDTRPLHDPDRLPWWKQNIRPDFLLFNFHQFRLNYSHSCVEIMANEIDLFYCVSI